MAKKLVVLLSGGYDSMAALVWAMERGDVTALFVDYRQPQLKHEARAVRAVCRRFDVPLVVQQWYGAAFSPDGYVAARNVVLLSMGAALAESIGARELVFASITASGDFARHDTALPFVNAASTAFRHGTKNGVTVRAPFVLKTKAQVRAWLAKLKLDTIVSELSWSCLSPRRGRPCTRCLSCLDRVHNGVDELLG